MSIPVTVPEVSCPPRAESMIPHVAANVEYSTAWKAIVRADQLDTISYDTYTACVGYPPLRYGAIWFVRQGVDPAGDDREAWQ